MFDVDVTDFVYRGVDSLGDTVYESLRDAICDGVLKPGTRLREALLARQFNMSSTPIREAIRRLDHEGLATIEPRKGAVVAQPQWADLEGLLEVRELLGAYAVRGAASRATPEALAAAEATLAEADESLRREDRRTYARCDVRFHIMIDTMAGNEAIRRFDEMVQRQIQQARRSLDHLSVDRMGSSQAEHHEIVECIRRGDADAAEAAYRQHVRRSADALRDLFSLVDAPPERAPAVPPAVTP